MTSVVVIGGGVAGLSAAFELAGDQARRPDVAVLDAGEPGGALRRERVGGRLVDVGPDGFLARRPEATALVGELGAADELGELAAQGAWVYARGRLRPLPAGLALGVPTRLRAREALRLLGLRGTARAAVDLVAPRPPSRSALPDRAVGPLVADKLGRRVVDVLVDPLVGGIHAGRVRDLSAAAVFPPLLDAAQRRGSLMRALRAATPSPDRPVGPAFLSLREGMGALTGLLLGALGARGGTVVARGAATAVHRAAPGATRWVVETDAGAHRADAVVLATPPAVTARLLEPLDESAAALVGGIDAASVAVVTLRYRPDALTLPEGGTGILVPASADGPAGPFHVTAVTFLDRKWPHLGREDEVLLRASAGRVDDRRALELDDAELVARVHEELGRLVAAEDEPLEAHVTRWEDAFPQYRVNHLVRVEGIEAAVATLGGLAVAGAAYRGVGVPACIGSGRGAAREVRAWLIGQS